MGRDLPTGALPQPGEMVGHYRIVERIGGGGGGVVYRATDGRLKRDVAVKVLVDTSGAQADRLALFTQEAQAVAGLTHPNILTLHDFGTERGLWYSVTELLQGQTLRERLADGPLPVDEAVDYAIAIAHGLTAAHARNIVHRDLKPENLFVMKDGRLKILDFGIAKVGQPSAATIDDETTRTRVADDAAMSGTLRYMSPEQLRGQEVDQRSDLFALGTVLFEMLAGRHPFLRPSSMDTVTAILRDSPPSLTTVNAAVPASLDRIVRRSLKKLPSERFQSAGEIAAALEAIRDHRPPAADTAEPLPADVGKKRMALAALGGGLALVAVVFVLLSTMDGEPPQTLERPAPSGPAPPASSSVQAPVSELITLTIDPPRGGTVISEGITCGTMGSECSRQHPRGKLVVMKALADPEFSFKGFTGEGCGRGGETVMSAPRKCTAVFARATDMMAAHRPPASGGSSAGGSAAPPGPAYAPSIPAASVKPPPTPESVARNEIQLLLEAYRTAYEARNLTPIRTIYPGVAASHLNSLTDVKSFEYTYATPPEYVDLDPALGTATVRVTAQQTVEGRKPQVHKMVFTLRRFDGVWRIADLKVTPE